MTQRGTLDELALEQAVTRAGGSWERIKSDLTCSRDEIDLQLALTRGQAFSLGLSGTPTYLVGERLIEGALTANQFKRALGLARSSDDRSFGVPTVGHFDYQAISSAGSVRCPR
jgi:protein-disulfide isomerase